MDADHPSPNSPAPVFLPQPYQGHLSARPTEAGKRFGQQTIDVLAPLCAELRDAGLNRVQLYTALLTTTREVLARAVHAKLGQTAKPPVLGPAHPTWARQADFVLRTPLEGLVEEALAKNWAYPETLAVLWDFVPMAIAAMPAQEPGDALLPLTTAAFKINNRLPT